MTKTDHDMLGRLFEAEFNDRLPFQSHAKRYHALAEQGLCAKMKVTLPGRFPVEVTGWALTELGRLEYCLECSKK